MDVQDVASELNLSAGEYQIWTDKKIQADKEIGRVKSTSIIIDIYPNPVEENITVSSNELISSYEIMDSQGKIIDELSLNIPSSEVNVNVNNLPKGIYFIRVTTGSKTGLAKFIR
jgi:selenophosphate synthase